MSMLYLNRQNEKGFHTFSQTSATVQSNPFSPQPPYVHLQPRANRTVQFCTDQVSQCMGNK